MNIKNIFRAFLFFLFQLELHAEAAVPDHRIDNSVLPKAMRLANKGNYLAMRHISVIFELEHKSLGDVFYQHASNLWAYMAAQRGDRVCVSRLLHFMREHPGQALPVPFNPRQGAVKIEGDILERLCLLPEQYNAALLYDLLPIIGGRIYLLRAYPTASAVSWEESCFQECLLNRNFKVIPRCYRNYSPDSFRAGKGLSFWQIISMFSDAYRGRFQEYMRDRYTIDF